MITGIKYFVLLLIISLIPSETVYCSSEGGSFFKQQIVARCNDSSFFACLSEIKSSFVVERTSDTEDTLTGCDEDDADAYKKNGEYPMPCSIETVVRTSDWLPHFKFINTKQLDDKNQHEILRDKSLPYPKKSYAAFIPALKYYVYTLEKIIT